MFSRIVTGVLAGLAALVVYRIGAGGNTALAVACAVGFGLALYVYTSSRARTYRYLFPGLAGIAMFIIAPLLYTLWIGFTNYSSKNLLTFEHATEVLLGEVYKSDSARYEYTLHADGGGYRLVLRTGDADETEAEPGGEAEPSMFDDPVAPGSEAGSAGSASAGAGSATPGSAAPASAGGEPAGSAGSAVAGSAAGATAGSDGSAGSAAAVAAAPPAPRPTVFVTPVLPLTATTDRTIDVVPLEGSGFAPGDALPLKDVIAHQDAIRAIRVQFPDGSSAAMESLREFTPYFRLFKRNSDGSLTNQKTQARVAPNMTTGFYETAAGEQLTPGFTVHVGLAHYIQIFTEAKFRAPFFRVFAWTVVFAGLSVLLTASLGMLLAELLSWEGLRFAGVYRVLLFLPYAVPGFISILVFKGLFNQNFGEINMILDAVLGIRPNWSGDAMLARLMILIVNTWLGYPYVMLMCLGLQKSIPRDLYEASALAGAGPLTNFFQITWPLIRRPLTPLLVASFAFNFNNFVIIFLLTTGKPDFLNTTVPAGETDILVSYTYRIAFFDTGQNFGLAAAISTIIFAIVAVLSVINLRLTKATAEDRR